MNALEKVIFARIETEGPIPFEQFMELALYHPHLGYYAQPSRKIGRHGDFYTSVSVGPVFGQLLAREFEDRLQLLDSERFQLIEAGAHRGDLAADILEHLDDSIRQRIEYVVVEPKPVWRNVQKTRLNSFLDSVRWVTALEEIPNRSVAGIIFSNELLDAFPCRRLSWNKAARTWREILVGAVQTKLAFQSGAARPPVPVLEPALEDILPEGFTTEVNPAANHWWRTAAERLDQGWLLTFDYGLRAEEFFRPERANGTVRAYSGHHLVGDLLANPGEQDITGHVNFTALEEAGAAAGLKEPRLMQQSTFLTNILQRHAGGLTWTQAERNQFRTLTHPEFFGRKFHCLEQRRLRD